MNIDGQPYCVSLARGEGDTSYQMSFYWDGGPFVVPVVVLSRRTPNTSTLKWS